MRSCAPAVGKAKGNCPRGRIAAALRYDEAVLTPQAATGSPLPDRTRTASTRLSSVAVGRRVGNEPPGELPGVRDLTGHNDRKPRADSPRRSHWASHRSGTHTSAA